MAKSASENAAGKADNNVQAAAAQKFGDPQEKKQNPLRTTISSVTCGDLNIRFESIEWLNKEDPSKYEAPIPSFVGRVSGYTNAKGFAQDINLSGDPEDLKNLIGVLQDVLKFVESTNVKISKTYLKQDIGVAYEKFAPNGGKPKA